jgi:chromate transporter
MENLAPAARARVPLHALYRVFFWIGVYSFGGGLTPWMYREAVEARAWMSREEFLSGLAVAQVMPGVNSTNMAIFIGQRLRGALGAVVALTAMLTAPFAFVIAAAMTYDVLLAIPAIAVALVGVAAAATGMLLRMGMTVAHAGLRSIPAALIMAATFVAVGVLRWPVIPVLAVVVPLSVAAAWPRGTRDAG